MRPPRIRAPAVRPAPIGPHLDNSGADLLASTLTDEG